MIFKRFILASGALLALAIISGCATHRVEAPSDVATKLSTRYPVRTVTSFTPGLACFDQLMLVNKVQPIYVTAATLPDYSEARGTAGYGTRDMLISAISEMSKLSAGIRYVAFDRSTPDIVALQNSHPRKSTLRIPDFFIRGAVTQINSDPYSKQAGYSVNAARLTDQILGAGASSSNSLSLSSISLDLAVGLVNNYQLLPGVFSANTMAVEKRSNSTEYTLGLSKLGLNMNMGENRAQAISQSMRSLVEVGAIELFGKLYDLPYWECLAELGSDDPNAKLAQEAFDSLSAEQRLDNVALRLRELGMLGKTAAITDAQGKHSKAMRSAIMQYRTKHDLLGGPDIDWALYEKLFAPVLLAVATPTPNNSPALKSAPGEAPANPKATEPSGAGQAK